MLVRRARLSVGGFSDDQIVVWDESRLFLAGGEANLAYYGRLGGNEDAAWHREWTNQRVLPDLVRLSFGSGEQAETILIAPALDYSAAKMARQQLDLYFANIPG